MKWLRASPNEAGSDFSAASISSWSLRLANASASEPAIS